MPDVAKRDNRYHVADRTALRRLCEKCLQLLELLAMWVERWRATFWPLASPSEAWFARPAKARPGRRGAVTSSRRTSTTRPRLPRRLRELVVSSSSFHRTSIRRLTFAKHGL